MKRRKLVAVLMIATPILSGCGRETVGAACGVFRDSLLGVEATTRDGQRRLDGHYEAGIRTGCWTRRGR